MTVTFLHQTRYQRRPGWFFTQKTRLLNKNGKNMPEKSGVEKNDGISVPQKPSATQTMEFPFRENRLQRKPWNFRSVKIVFRIDRGISVP
jgi:hypothetical protein